MGLSGSEVYSPSTVSCGLEMGAKIQGVGILLDAGHGACQILQVLEALWMGEAWMDKRMRE